MYPRDKSRGYTGTKRSVAFGTLRTLFLSFELRASPRDPYLSEIKMAKTKAAAKVLSIRLRMSEEDKRSIEVKAAERKLSVTEFLTRAGLGRAARQRADVDAINLLRDCADQLRGIQAALKNGGPDFEARATEALGEPMRAVVDAIVRVWTSGEEQ